jgi:hypothetical protein
MPDSELETGLRIQSWRLCLEFRVGDWASNLELETGPRIQSWRLGLEFSAGDWA